MSTNHGRGDKGFTLVEVMVSLLIFMVVSLGLLPLLINGIRVNHDNRLRAQAWRLAGKEMAQLQVVDYGQLMTVSNESFLAGDIELLKQVEIDQPQAGQSRVTVSARWQKQGRGQRYQLQTIRSAP